MHGATSKEIITPCAVGFMRVRALVKQGYLDVKCYYSPHFSTTLLSQVSDRSHKSSETIYLPRDATFLCTKRRRIGLRFEVEFHQLGQCQLQSRLRYLYVDLRPSKETFSKSLFPRCDSIWSLLYSTSYCSYS